MPRLAYREVADRLRSMILKGGLRARHRLPTENEMCDQFGVSRRTVREALRMLSSQGLLATSRGVGGGSTVARIHHQDVTEMLKVSVALLSRSDGLTVASLLEARELLEVPAARLAAAKRTDEELELIRRIIPRSLRGINASQIYPVNKAFHEALLDAAHNRLLHAMTEPGLHGTWQPLRPRACGTKVLVSGWRLTTLLFCWRSRPEMRRELGARCTRMCSTCAQHMRQMTPYRGRVE